MTGGTRDLEWPGFMIYLIYIYIILYISIYSNPPEKLEKWFPTKLVIHHTISYFSKSHTFPTKLEISVWRFPQIYTYCETYTHWRDAWSSRPQPQDYNCTYPALLTYMYIRVYIYIYNIYIYIRICMYVM